MPNCCTIIGRSWDLQGLPYRRATSCSGGGHLIGNCTVSLIVVLKGSVWLTERVHSNSLLISHRWHCCWQRWWMFYVVVQYEFYIID